MESLPNESGGSFDFFLDDNIDFRVRSSKQNLDMVQQMLADAQDPQLARAQAGERVDDRG